MGGAVQTTRSAVLRGLVHSETRPRGAVAGHRACASDCPRSPRGCVYVKRSSRGLFISRSSRIWTPRDSKSRMNAGTASGPGSSRRK